VVPRIRNILALAALVAALAALAWPAKKKKEEETQTLQLPKELPMAVAGETRRLVVHVTPLSAKGLLSQQVRDALRNLEHQAAGNPVLQIRAFVAGSGDLRRVRDLVSEIFTERRQPLPALSLIQAGGLPLAGAQIVLEAVSNGRRDANAGGLVFLPGQLAVSENPLDPVAPLLDRSLVSLRAAFQAAGAAPADALRVTCFLSSLDRSEALRQRVETEYPRAALDILQPQRAPQRAEAACEAVVGLRESHTPETPTAAAGSPSPVFLVTPHAVLSGTQVSFGFQEQDARLAFDRLGRALEPLGVSLRDVVLARFYPLSRRIEEGVRRQFPVLFPSGNPPATTFTQFEGLSSSDAGFAVEVVAAKQ
jgi:enamine deaminase RidA (YjgF/YER057c/UK114 family)